MNCQQQLRTILTCEKQYSSQSSWIIPRSFVYLRLERLSFYVRDKAWIRKEKRICLIIIVKYIGNQILSIWYESWLMIFNSKFLWIGHQFTRLSVQMKRDMTTSVNFGRMEDTSCYVRCGAPVCCCPKEVSLDLLVYQDFFTYKRQCISVSLSQDS